MAAIQIDSPRWRDGWGDAQRDGWGEPLASPPAPRPALRLVDSGARRPSPAVLRRRRFVVAVVLGLLLAATLAVASAVLARPTTAGSLPQGRQTHVVQPGETYWSIAAATSHGGDLRIAVDALVDANGGRPLFPGDRIEVP